MKHEKLIRGVMYDNPNLVEEKAFETALALSTIHMPETIGEQYDRLLPNCSCPTKEEFITSVVADILCNPSKEEENLLIPASLIDNKLYKDLKKIDIGESVVKMFMELRVDEHRNSSDNEETKYKYYIGIEDKNGVVQEFTCGSKEEAIHMLTNEIGSYGVNQEQIADAIEFFKAA